MANVSIDLQRHTVRQASAAASRSAWIDRLRVGLTCLVIFHHAAITYGASGSWFFRATEEISVPLTFLAAVNQAFFMGLFFLVSGYLAPRSLDRKGPAAFLKDRAVRLGLPVLLFGFLLGPLTVAIAQEPLVRIWGRTVAEIMDGTFILGPLWFPAALLVFSVGLALLPRTMHAPRPIPGFLSWLALALVTGVLALLIRQAVPVGATVLGFQLGYFASYVVLFALGVTAGRNDWLEALPRRGILLSLAVGAAALPVLPMALLSTDDPAFETGLSLAAIVYAFWEPLVALGAIAGLIALSRRPGLVSARARTRAAANSYGAFILHAPILVATSRALDAFGLSNGPALIVSVTATVTIAFVVTDVLRRSPLIRRVI
ncbi:acyltransferase family protein [Silicimonas algicola]|uniref:Acyltransferase-like protein n=1 Tax=Silicimonas algicola TaxID=1826607 RepID=A0A316GDP0_9RHOB|nr:acyltransferase family protein [Silicimonas algicola]PWK52777.1 acyltransferase-like protein [Silicimonas algicola]